MKCPECSEKALSFGRFLVILYPRNVTCRNCGAHLHLSENWLKAYWYSYLVTFILAVIAASLRAIVGWSLLTSFIGFVILALAFMYYFWLHAEYSGVERSTT